MSYTQQDLTEIHDAIMALARGERVVSVTVDGRTTQYASTDIEKLKSLRNEIVSEQGDSSPKPLRIRPGRI